MSLRPIHPAQSSASDSSKSTGKSGTERKEVNPARRTRVTPKDVTTNACIQCKKARTKVMGAKTTPIIDADSLRFLFFSCSTLPWTSPTS